MNVRVLIVDDSFFFRRRLSEAIDGKKGIEVVGFASNGKEAIDLVQKLHPDVVTLDIEMPHINGLEALKTIMKKAPVPVLMFSALTTEGADVTMSALEYGALDFLPKNFSELAGRKEDVIEIITNKVLALSRAKNLASIRSDGGFGGGSEGADTGRTSARAKTSVKKSDSSSGTALKARTEKVVDSLKNGDGRTGSNDYKTLSKQISRNTSDLSMKLGNINRKVTVAKNLLSRESMDVEDAVAGKGGTSVSMNDLKWRDVSASSVARDMIKQESLRKSTSDLHNFQKSFNEDGKTKVQAHVNQYASKLAPTFDECIKAENEDAASENGDISRDELNRLIGIKRNQPFVDKSVDKVKNQKTAPAKSRKREYAVMVIGASTGGPAALFDMIEHFPADFPIPILIVQHMPENFTTAFAERLNKSSKIKVTEAKDGQELLPGYAFVAPGGKQTLVSKVNGRYLLKIKNSPVDLYYRPCIDITMGSMSQVYGDKVLGIVMTGMGADGTRGSGMLHSSGSTVWVQGELSCVIYGMPKSVITAGYADRVVELAELPKRIIEEVCGRQI